MTVGTVALFCGVLWGCSDKDDLQTAPTTSGAELTSPAQGPASSALVAPEVSAAAKVPVPLVLGSSLEEAAASLQSAKLLCVPW